MSRTFLYHYVSDYQGYFLDEMEILVIIFVTNKFERRWRSLEVHNLSFLQKLMSQKRVRQIKNIYPKIASQKLLSYERKVILKKCLLSNRILLMKKICKVQAKERLSEAFSSTLHFSIELSHHKIM